MQTFTFKINGINEMNEWGCVSLTLLESNDRRISVKQPKWLNEPSNQQYTHTKIAVVSYSKYKEIVLIFFFSFLIRLKF